MGTGHGGAGTRSSCGSHKSTWWQSGRLRHAEPGKSAPATRAGGRVAGLLREVGPAQGWGGGASVPLEEFSCSKPKPSFGGQSTCQVGVEEEGTGQPRIAGIPSSTSSSLVSCSGLLHPKSLPPSAPLAAPAAQPAGLLLLDAQRNSQPSETRRGPSGPSGPPRPHPALDMHSGRPPTCVSFGRDGTLAPHTRPYESHPLPSLTSSQRSWPRKLSSRVLCMPVPEPSPGLPVPLRTPARVVRTGPGGPASGALTLYLVRRLLALRSSRRRRHRPNIWQPRPAPAAAANGAWAGPKRPRPQARVDDPHAHSRSQHQPYAEGRDCCC